MKKLLLILFGSFALLSPAVAQNKVAIVDVDKVLEGYYKTADAKKKVDEWTRKVQEKIKLEQDRGLAMLDEIQKLQMNAKNLQPNDPQAPQMKIEFEKKVKAVRAHSDHLDTQKKELSSALQKNVSKLNEGILIEVCTFIKEYGEKQGFDIVFNQSLKNPGASDVMYVKSATDITGPVVKELNASKPAN